MSQEIHPLFNLNHKVALVTGGGSGLGREFCDVLAEFGADIICADINLDWAEETCQIIKKYGHESLPLEMDVSKPDQVSLTYKRLKETFGKLDILVNNAGISAHNAPIDKVELENWHKVIDIDLHGTFYCLREGLRMMVEQQKGSIINISSISGLVGHDPDVMMNSPYAAAKAAVIGLTRQAAVEYGRYSIRVNCIAPGFFSGTRLGKSEEGKELRKLVELKTPLGRSPLPANLEACCFILRRITPVL